MTDQHAVLDKHERDTDESEPRGELLDDWPLPEPPVAASRPSRRRRVMRLVRYVALVVVLVATAIVGVERFRANQAAARRLPIQDAVLVANQIDIVSPSSGTIRELPVERGDWVEAGTVVAVVDAVRPAAGGGQQVVATEIEAPLAGRVGASPLHVGRAVLGGEVLLQLFNPDDVHLEARLANTGAALDLEPGMPGRVWTAGIEPIAVELTGLDPGLITGDQQRAKTRDPLLDPHRAQAAP